MIAGIYKSRERLRRGLSTLLLPLASILLVTTALAWQIETVETGWRVGNHCSIAVDDSNRAHISYNGSAPSGLRYAKWTGSDWNIKTVDSIHWGVTWTSIALDSSGYPHISYREIGNIKGLKYARLTGTGWELERVETSPTGVGAYSSIAIDDSGRPHIAYGTGTGANLRYAFFTGSEWLKQTVDSVGRVGEYCSMALQFGMTPYISYLSYVDGFLDLKLTWRAGDEWQFEMVDTEREAGWGTSIAIGSNGYPQIAYYSRDPYELRIARWSGSEWILESLDILGGTQGGTSIALDSYGYAHVTYHDNVSEALKHAYWNGSSWQTEMIDNQYFSTGVYNSIAIDRLDNVHVAYHSYLDTIPTYSELRYAKRDPTTGVETELPDRHFSYRLFQNHPNPCREFTTINYQLPEPGHATLRIYDISGRVVRTLVDERREAGSFTVRWDGRDGTGSPMPSGVYFYQMKVGEYRAAKKLLLVR